jgi:hypothetical protein
MQRLVSACRRIGVDFAAQLEPLGSMLDKRQRRKFEQKAAKETKAHWGLGFRDGYSVGPSATLSGFPIILVASSLNGATKCSALYRHVGESVSNFAAPVEPRGSMLDKRQRRKFEQKAAKETKAHWGLGFRDLFGRVFGDSPVFQSPSMP